MSVYIFVCLIHILARVTPPRYAHAEQHFGQRLANSSQMSLAVGQEEDSGRRMPGQKLCRLGTVEDCSSCDMMRPPAGQRVLVGTGALRLAFG